MRLPSLRRRAARPKQPKPLPFTEAQIRERAYKLWQANPEGSAEAHWDGAIETLKRERSPTWKVRQSWQTAFNTENRAFSLDVLKFVVSAFGVLATIFAGVGLYLTYQNSQAERQLNSERLVTDRFAKAVEQLGSKELDVRIGAIYSLERIAKDSPKDHWTIMEVLTAFIRNKSPLPKGWKPGLEQERKPVKTDVQSALTVIGRREVRRDPENTHLDLTNTNLRGITVFGADFRNADFNGSNLSRANFNRANLSKTFFTLSDLTGATFIEANLSYAYFNGAELREADLTRANIGGANFGSVFSQSARSSKVYTEVRTNVSAAQIKAALYWQDAYYNHKFRQELRLPPAKPNPFEPNP